MSYCRPARLAWGRIMATTCPTISCTSTRSATWGAFHSRSCHVQNIVDEGVSRCLEETDIFLQAVLNPGRVVDVGLANAVMPMMAFMGVRMIVAHGRKEIALGPAGLRDSSRARSQLRLCRPFRGQHIGHVRSAPDRPSCGSDRPTVR